MSRIIFLIIAVGLVTVAVAAININDVTARRQPEFIQIAVLAEHRADYGTDEQVVTIPAVSIGIIEDAARDFRAQPSVRIITYTSLPAKEPGPDHEEQQVSESLDEIKHDNGQGNGNNQGSSVENDNHANQGNNENSGSNPSNGSGTNGNNGKGNGSDEDKNKDKDKGNDREKEKDNGGGGGGNEGKESKPEKEQ